MATKQHCILVVDDNPDDLHFIQRAFEKIGMTDPIRTVSGGIEAIRYLAGEDPYGDRLKNPFPSLVLTDLRMTRGDGFHVLENIKKNPAWHHLPVLVMSNAEDRAEVSRCYQLGAEGYVVKPADVEELQRLLDLFRPLWLRHGVSPARAREKFFDTQNNDNHPDQPAGSP